MERLRQVEQPRASGMKTVRKEVAVGRHLLFSVMRMRPSHARRD